MIPNSKILFLQLWFKLFLTTGKSIFLKTKKKTKLFFYKNVNQQWGFVVICLKAALKHEMLQTPKYQSCFPLKWPFYLSYWIPVQVETATCWWCVKSARLESRNKRIKILNACLIFKLVLIVWYSGLRNLVLGSHRSKNWSANMKNLLFKFMRC